MRVTKYLSGTTVFKSGLNQLPNAFLVALDREGKTLHALSPDEILQASKGLAVVLAAAAVAAAAAAAAGAAGRVAVQVQTVAALLLLAG